MAMKLSRLYLLIHGFCYEEMLRADPDMRAKRSLYLEREREVSDLWRERVSEMPNDEGLAVIPWPYGPDGRAADFERYATYMIGDRCLVLNAPMPEDQAYWKMARESIGNEVIAELGSAFLGQGHSWNLEELDTALHSLAATHLLGSLLRERDMEIDPKTVKVETWGASFEGCVTKYGGNLTRLLGLANPAEADFDMCVPDARFLLNVLRWETIPVERDLRLYLFETPDRLLGLFALTLQSIGQPALCVDVPLDSDDVVVLTKFGDRIWPGEHEKTRLRAETGYLEPPQKLVEEVYGSLRVPVNGGMVYRMAKAPAFISPQGSMTWDGFRGTLLRARIHTRGRGKL